MTQACGIKLFYKTLKKNLTHISLRQFNDAFEGVRSVNDIKRAKLEKHLSRQEITVNIGDLKRKFLVRTDILTIL